MQTIKEYIRNKKEKAQSQYEADVRADFRVVEKGGFLWLTHQGIAFMKVESTSKASDVAQRLAHARDTAIEYENL